MRRCLHALHIKGEAAGSHFVFGNKRRTVIRKARSGTGGFKVVSTCLKIEEGAQVCDWETLKPSS